MKEIWRPVVGYECSYFVSNLGNIKNKEGRLLALDTSQRGYSRVKLCRHGVSENKKVHRMVAEAFIPNPYCLPQINHIDENKKNNRIDNLEWVDNKTNCKLRKNKSVRKKAVVSYIDGIETNYYDSICAASRETGVSRYGISSCCNDIQKEAGGIKWKYAK